jgi:class 3 adenylate cyclase
MSQNITDLQLGNLSELNTKLIDKSKKNGILLSTVVFWDIKGFSNLCDVLKTHSTLLVPFLKEFFEMAREIIFEYDGVSDKYMGDGVMALLVLKVKVKKVQRMLFVPLPQALN